MKKISTHIILLAMIFIIPSTILSAEKIAALLKLKGNVLVKQITSKEYTPAYKGQMLLDGDWIKTGDGDFAAIIFLDGTQLKLSEAAELELRSERISAKEQNTDLFLAEGELWTKVKKRKRSDFNIATPVSVAAVKGTEFNLNFNDVDKTSELFVFEGSVEFQNDLGKILAKEMTYSIASIDKAPKKPKKMKEKTLPDWQNNIKVDWGFQLIPEKSGRQPVNVPLKVGIQVNDLLKGTVASNFSEEINLKSRSETLLLSADGGNSWSTDITIPLVKGKGTMSVKSSNIGSSSLVVSSENTESRKLDLNFFRTKAQNKKLTNKVSNIAEKRNLGDLKDKIEGKKLTKSKVAKGNADIDDILQKVDTGEYEIVEVVSTENSDGSVSVKLIVKPRK